MKFPFYTKTVSTVFKKLNSEEVRTLVFNGFSASRKPSETTEAFF